MIGKLKKYAGDKRALYYYTNKSVRVPALRRTLAGLVKCFTPKADAPSPVPEDIARLKRDGILVWDQLLDAATVQKIRDYLKDKPVHDFLEDFKQAGKTPMKLEDVQITEQRKLKYFDKDIAGCPEIVALGNSEKILSLVSAYLGCKPTIAVMSAWWTKAGNGPSAKYYDDMFHRDVDDYKFIKLFVYLTDVNERNGAHSFVKGSQFSGQCTARRTFSDEEVATAFPKSDQLILTGRAGSGFLEDTWGLHRSTPCAEGERLLLHFLFSITSLNAQATPTPVAKNPGIDPYINRVYFE